MARYRYLKGVRKFLHRFLKNATIYLIIPSLILTIIIFGSLALYSAAFAGKIYPGISIAGVAIGGKTPKDSTFILSEKTEVPAALTLTYQDQSFKIKTSDIELSYDFTASAERAYEYTRTGNFFYDLGKRIDVLFHPESLGLITNLDNEKLAKVISVISGQISIDPIDPSVKLVEGLARVDKGVPGKEVNQEVLRAAIGEALSQAKPASLEIPVDTIDHTLSQAEADKFQAQAEKYIGKSIQMKFEFSTFSLSDNDILKLLDPKSGYKDVAIIDIVQKITVSINRSPQNPKFIFENGRVSQFQPALDGINVNGEKYKNQLTSSLDTLANSNEISLSFDIPVAKTPPEVTTDKVNNLGIKELVGRGTSTYYHSIPSRVHNIVLAASRINGTLVKPGETFSFNDTLGDVSGFTGYQQAYIISEGKTILGDGGGVCQVSTTLFRAILNAGLPITERQAHAYRVGYYEQDSPPGLDATVYSPSPDLKFKNDTPGYILIEATADPKHYSLVFELYGTGDGRTSTISKPVVTDKTAPPDDLYQDDPTLPTGTIKQIDFKAWGAKVTFNYSVKRNGQEIYKKTFVSNYRPWQAVYLRGTGSAI